MENNKDSANPYAPPRARLDDVSDAPVAEQYELASRGARFGGALIDGLLQFALIWGVWSVIFGRSLLDEDISFGDQIVMIAISMGLFLLVQGYLLATQGQTIGKKLLGMRIVRSDYSRADAGRVIGLRYLLTWTISAVPLIGGLFALIDSLLIFRESKRCLHDDIADTIVVKV